MTATPSADTMDPSRSGGPDSGRPPGSLVGRIISRIVANRVLMQLMTAVTMLAVLIYGTATFPLQAHIVLAMLAIAVAIVVTRILPEYRLISVVLSVAISLRYIIWRGLETLNLDAGLAGAVVSLLLYGAEFYTVFVLIGGYFQTSVFLDRKPAPIPIDTDKLPTVDVFIPTYNEPVEIVRRTLVAALALEYPKKRVYLLDDGQRDEMRALADEVGSGYITRTEHKHAKAGNINHAMEHTTGELIAFFDADHAPVRSFLQLTVGFFLENDNLALAQTPHHFYNPDPFERNLYTTRQVPPEQNLFYHLVQVSNDFWNSAFFCGSCAVIRRAALDDIKGMATETVTEDAHTALKMQSRGWDTAYLNIPQAAGLATESFSAYVGQRIRWARGMAQILRIDTPFLKRGLNWYQRVNYTFAASHFFFGVPRMIFLLAPVTYLIFRLNPLAEDVRTVLVYALPHLALAYINASAAHSNQRHTFWPEVYETAMAPYSAAVTTLALLFPKKGQFNVTPKGASSDHTKFEWRVAWVTMLMFALCLVGLPFFVWQYAVHPAERATLWVALAWNLYNIVLLLAALAAAFQRPQRRQSHRIPVSYPMVAIEQAGLADRGDDPLDDLDELAEDSYAPVEGIDPGEVYQDEQDELARRPETSEASYASENRPVPTLIPEQEELDEGVWRATGQTIDLTENGARFLLPRGVEVPRNLQLTLLGDDGTRTTVLAEALGAWNDDKGTVVRARFLHMNERQTHGIIRLMFSDPNAWSHDRYTVDRPVGAFLSVATAPYRVLFYALGLLKPPHEHEAPPEDAREVHAPVLQCFHCNGVLLRPLPVCPHCGEPLGTLETEDTESDRRQGPRVRRRAGVGTYLVPALMVVLAVILTFGWNDLFGTPASAQTREEALALSHSLAAEDGAELSEQFLSAIRRGGPVPAQWGSRMTNRRQEYPGDEDPWPAVHEGDTPTKLGELFAKMHRLESRYRRGDTPANLRVQLEQLRAGFIALQ